MGTVREESVMSRYIDAEAVKEEFTCKGDEWINNIIDFEPSIDIVRCKECMFSKVYQNDSSGVMGRFCEAFTQVRMVSDDDYCSYGERRE